MAWSSSEFYLALLLQRLMASAQLETPEQIDQAVAGDADMVVDMNAVFALYYAVESSRGRRDLVRRLAEARHGEGFLPHESLDRIKSLLTDHASIGKNRNGYAHGAMGRADDGSYILLDRKMMISRSDWSTRLKNPQVRANNNKVEAKRIDEVTSSIDEWINRALDTLRTTETQPSPVSPNQSSA